MTRLVPGFVVRFDAGMPGPTWLARDTATSRARALAWPVTRSEGDARVFPTRDAADTHLAGYTSARAFTVVKVARPAR